MNHSRRAACVRFVALTGMFAGALAAGPARAESVSAADARAIREIVEAQLAAFAADDAGRAYSYAAPEIREMFGTAEQFMRMVRTNYPVVYRPAAVVFLAPVRAEGQVVQSVHMTDDRGKLWLAVYRLDRQADLSWRIAGCVVQPSAGRLT